METLKKKMGLTKSLAVVIYYCRLDKTAEKRPTAAVSTKHASSFYLERSITKRTLHIRDC
jgi:hypothetical protein